MEVTQKLRRCLRVILLVPWSQPSMHSSIPKPGPRNVKPTGLCSTFTLAVKSEMERCKGAQKPQLTTCLCDVLQNSNISFLLQPFSLLVQALPCFQDQIQNREKVNITKKKRNTAEFQHTDCSKSIWLPVPQAVLHQFSKKMLLCGQQFLERLA